MALLKILPTVEAKVDFYQKLKSSSLEIKRRELTTLQVNVGLFCNQACLHCHVEAGPKRTEKMSEEVSAQIVKLMQNTPSIKTLDITGGAPELHDAFRYLVEEATKCDVQVIDRCNLTVFFEEGQEDLLDFLIEHKVRVIASLPCYSAENVDEQRGSGTFEKSIKALQMLNEAGYAEEGSGLVLDLVYNPLGASLPPSQEMLEKDYKKNLDDWFGIKFNSLFTITNVPIKRFLHHLHKTGEYEGYMDLLLNSFNIAAAEAVMCRDLVSISWDGNVYDCDFNQMLEIPLANKARSVFDFQDFNQLSDSIAFADHCYACTAGAGSSCTGSLV